MPREFLNRIVIVIALVSVVMIGVVALQNLSVGPPPSDAFGPDVGARAAGWPVGHSRLVACPGPVSADGTLLTVASEATP